MGAATLLNVIRLVIHAHFEPYNDSNNNLFEYLTLIITSLTGVGGLLLQGLETSKEYAISRSDDVGKQAAEEQIKGVNMFLDIGVYCIIIVFSLFFANIMVGQNNKVRKICARLRHLCARPEDAEEGDGSSTEMTMLSNPSFLVASRDGGGGGEENEEGLTAVAANRAAGGYSEGKADTSSNAVGTTTGESKGSDDDEAARGGIAARNQDFFQHQRTEKERADAEAAQEKPDTQYDNPMMQQQQQRQQQMAAAVDSYDVFDTGAERTVPPGGGQDTQYGNPMTQQQQQHGVGQGQGRQDAIGAVARTTSIVLE